MSPHRFFYPDVEAMPVPSGHRFPARKYQMLRTLIEREAILPAAGLHPSPPARRDDLLLAHDPAYVDAVLAGTLDKEALRRIGLPWSETLVRRSLATVGGAMAAASSALETGLSGQLAGGTHHAHRDFGSGFCVFNDLAVAALALLARRRAPRASPSSTSTCTRATATPRSLAPIRACSSSACRASATFHFAACRPTSMSNCPMVRRTRRISRRLTAYCRTLRPSGPISCSICRVPIRSPRTSSGACR